MMSRSTAKSVSGLSACTAVGSDRKLAQPLCRLRKSATLHRHTLSRIAILARRCFIDIDPMSASNTTSRSEKKEQQKQEKTLRCLLSMRVHIVCAMMCGENPTQTNLHPPNHNFPNDDGYTPSISNQGTSLRSTLEEHSLSTYCTSTRELVLDKMLYNRHFHDLLTLLKLYPQCLFRIVFTCVSLSERNH